MASPPSQSPPSSLGPSRNLRDYALVTAAYWAFTLTDGALRMLVLLHLHERGFGALELASVFLLYEFLGVLTNLFGGWVGARFGLKPTLTLGLALQVVACLLLAREHAFEVLPWIIAAQGLSGIAKDLTKTGAKSYIKQVVPEGDSKGLMAWVSLLTGSKNTLKGVGYFLGGWMLAAFGTGPSVLGMAGLIATSLVVTGLALPKAVGKAKRIPRIRDLWPTDPRLRRLSMARLYLFASRDVWFAIALPLFLAETLGWSHPAVGAVLALWIIGYGLVQASAPRWTGARGSTERQAPDARALGRWTQTLLVPLALIPVGYAVLGLSAPGLLLALGIFGVVFAANSAVHSYLVVHYAESDGVSLGVGFYYMANAVGRLLGTFLSGVAYATFDGGVQGLGASLALALLLVLLSRFECARLALAEVR